MPAVLLCFGLLMEGVNLHLIHHGPDTGKGGNVDHPVQIEIGNTNGTDIPGFIQVLQCPVGTVIIGKGLVQKHQIQIIGPQLPHGFQYRCLCLLVAVMFDPDFGGQEYFLPENT